MAVKKTKSGRIGIMATQTSIDSHVHKKMLLDQNSGLFVVEQACPDFVPLIETQAPHKKLESAVKKYLTPLLKKNIDTLILGCTHYTFLQNIIHELVSKITLISAANCIRVTNSVSEKPHIVIQITADKSLGPFIKCSYTKEVL